MTGSAPAQSMTAQNSNISNLCTPTKEVKSKSNGLEAWKTSKPQSRRPLFDVELYLTVHKSFVSTSLNIIHRGCTFHLSYPYWSITKLYENTMSSITVTVHKSKCDEPLILICVIFGSFEEEMYYFFIIKNSIQINFFTVKVSGYDVIIGELQISFPLFFLYQKFT